MCFLYIGRSLKMHAEGFLRSSDGPSLLNIAKKNIMVSIKGEPPVQRRNRWKQVVHGLRCLYLQNFAESDFQPSMKRFYDLEKIGAYIPAYHALRLAKRFHDFTNSLSIAERHNLKPFADLMIKGLKEGRVSPAPETLKFLLSYFVRSHLMSEAVELSAWLVDQNEYFVDSETWGAMISIKSNLGYSEEECVAMFKESFRRASLPHAKHGAALSPDTLNSEMLELFMYRTPTSHYAILEVYLKKGNCIKAALELQNVFLFGPP